MTLILLPPSPAPPGWHWVRDDSAAGGWCLVPKSGAQVQRVKPGDGTGEDRPSLYDALGRAVKRWGL